MGVISLILVAAVFGPFFLAAFAGRSEQKKLSQSLQQPAKDLGLNLAQQEQWANIFIGIDPDKRTLLYTSKTERGTVEVKRLSLNGLVSCELHRQSQTYRQNDHKEEVLERLELHLGFGPKRQTTSLLFYQKSDRYSEDLEQQRAERWKSHILAYALPHRPRQAAA